MKNNVLTACLSVVCLSATGAPFVSVPGEVPAIPKRAVDGRVTRTSSAAFVRDVGIAKPVSRAVWRTSGLGVYEAFVNGKQVGDETLKPGFTQTTKCRHAFTHDVTALFDGRVGATNVLAAIVSTGWWSDAMGGPYGKPCGFMGELTLTHADGTVSRVETDGDWKAAYAGPVIGAGIYYGETYDARESTAFLTDASVCAAWPQAVLNTDFSGEVREIPAGAVVRRREDLTLKPVTAKVWQGVTDASSNAFGRVRIRRTYRPDEPMAFAVGETLVVDFGQNAAAAPDFLFAAASGTRLTARFSEMLNDENGEKTRGDDGPGGSVYLANMRACPSQLDYTFAGKGDERYSPRHSFWGYRYLSLTADGPVTVRQVTSVPVTSITHAQERATLVTGNADVNRLVENARWGMRSNYLSVPTDCPQRDERMGWGADTQVFSETALWFADVNGFLRKWLSDLRDCQLSVGGYPSVAPIGHFGEEKHSRFGWGDAGVIVPWTLWKMSGDLTVVREQWDSATRFMNEIDTRQYRSLPGECQPADWLSFERWETFRNNYWTHQDDEVHRWWNYLGACYWLWDARRMSVMARALGKDAEAAHYEKMSERALGYLRTNFMTEDGDLIEPFRGQQTAHLFAIKLGLAPSAAATKAMCERLVKIIETNGNRLATGFLGTSILMETLSDDMGRPDLAYTLLLQHDCPSWLYSVDQGATTIWERWNSYTKKDGFGSAEMNSFNHYASGAVVAWLFRGAAGIRLDGTRTDDERLVLRPLPDRRLGSVTAVCQTAFGTVRSDWRYEGGKWIWRFSVPERAFVLLPEEKDGHIFPAGEHAVELCYEE